MTKFITNEDALLKTLVRLRAANDNVTYRTSGGLRVMIRNDPDDPLSEDIAFDVSIIIEDEPPAVEKSLRNEIDISEDESGCIVVDEYSFAKSDTEALKTAMDFLNQVDHWTPCPCGCYLIKDAATMCYYCEMTAEPPGNADDDIFCPICHESGHPRWMIHTTCCKQKMHRKCKETCIASAALRLQDAQCPMCRASWD